MARIYYRKLTSNGRSLNELCQLLVIKKYTLKKFIETYIAEIGQPEILENEIHKYSPQQVQLIQEFLLSSNIIVE